jgi:hypothetical protein
MLQMCGELGFRPDEDRGPEFKRMVLDLEAATRLR